jgi:hypothetical protein
MTYDYEQDPREGMGVIVWSFFAVVILTLIALAKGGMK